MTAPSADNVLDVEQARRFHRVGVIEVFALWLPIFFWMAHLGSMAALVGYVREHPEKSWVLWLDTGVMGAGIAACTLIGILFAARYRVSEREGTPQGRSRFLAWHVVLAGLANLALTLAEGSYVWFLSVNHR